MCSGVFNCVHKCSTVFTSVQLCSTLIFKQLSEYFPIFPIRESRMYNMYMQTLKPQDIAVLLKILVTEPGWTIAGISKELFLSASEVHAALGRTQKAGLFNSELRKVNQSALEEFLVHGIRYVFYTSNSGLTRGMPTSIAAAPLNTQFSDLEVPPIWPHPLGAVRGYVVDPLYKRLPEAAAADAKLYMLLALTDALRENSPRVRAMAAKVLHEVFEKLRTPSR